MKRAPYLKRGDTKHAWENQQRIKDAYGRGTGICYFDLARKWQVSSSTIQRIVTTQKKEPPKVTLKKNQEVSLAHTNTAYPVCEECGSTDIHPIAEATWSIEEQQWDYKKPWGSICSSCSSQDVSEFKGIAWKADVSAPKNA